MKQTALVTEALVNTGVNKFLAFLACAKLCCTQPDQDVLSRQEIAPLTLKISQEVIEH